MQLFLPLTRRAFFKAVPVSIFQNFFFVRGVPRPFPDGADCVDDGILAGSLYAAVVLAFSRRAASKSCAFSEKFGTAALWIGAIYAPPPRRALFAALTMASVSSFVVALYYSDP